MEAPELPVDEEGRIAALMRLQILDTATEQRFDRYVRLATKLFHTPVTLIALVDSERLWFKSRCGIEETEIARDISICAHTILSDSVFVVPDATKDKRFFDNPMVTGDPGVRFYAGAPLVSREGYNLGTLCIADKKPREFSAEDCESLHELASMVSDELNVFVDEVTGLANRRGFNIAVDNVLNSTDYIAEKAALVLFDLDQFKNINDRFGHAAGDQALRTFAELMTEVFRKSDVMCRFGGDEFCVLLPNASESIARIRVKLLRKIVQESNQTGARPYKLKFSAGVCSMETSVGQSSIREIIENADKKLYKSKARRKLVAV